MRHLPTRTPTHESTGKESRMRVEPTWYRGMYGCPDDMYDTAALKVALAEQREEIAREIEAKYLGPDFGRQYDGRESPDAAIFNAHDEGLELAARIARGVTQ
jgi:hypothetical protein